MILIFCYRELRVAHLISVKMHNWRKKKKKKKDCERGSGVAVRFISISLKISSVVMRTLTGHFLLRVVK